MTAFAERIACVIRRVIGVPDYDRYLVHQQEHHPDNPPMSREAFVRDSLTRKYERPGSRCC